MTKAGKRSQRSVDVVALRDVLGSLDNAHGELVYSMLYLRYIQTGVFEQVDLVKARKYRKLCYCLFKMTGQMLSALADYTCVLLAGLASKEIAETRQDVGYSLELILEMTRRIFCKMRGTEGLPDDIAEEMDCIAVVKNARYNKFFGDWDSDEFMDMVR